MAQIKKQAATSSKNTFITALIGVVSCLFIGGYMLYQKRPQSVLNPLSYALCAPQDHKSIETIFGKLTIQDPVIKDLLNHPVMTRLPHIDQHGVLFYFSHKPTFNRYDHSLGVYALLKKFNRPLDEQIAGLLHDVSHPVFSHLGDMLFEDPEYQDSIHSWYLEQSGVESVLKKHEYTLAGIHHKEGDFKALEQSYPDMCADRIEYNLHTGHAFGFLTQKEINDIVDNLRFENNKWFFVSEKHALQFAHLPLYFTQHFWGCAENYVLQKWFVTVLKRAVELKLITFNQITFGTDQQIFDILKRSHDPVIKEHMTKCNDPQRYHSDVTHIPGTEDFETPMKFMAIDPLVRKNNTLVRLSTINKQFQEKYNALKARMRSIKIKYHAYPNKQ